MKKYRILKNDFKVLSSSLILYRIESLKDFKDVKKGDLGGYIESEDNLSQKGDCWIYDKSFVLSSAKVIDNAIVKNGSVLQSSAIIRNNALVSNVNISVPLVLSGGAIVKSPFDFIFITPLEKGMDSMTFYKTKKGISVNIGFSYTTLDDFETSFVFPTIEAKGLPFAQKYTSLLEVVRNVLN